MSDNLCELVLTGYRTVSDNPCEVRFAPVAVAHHRSGTMYCYPTTEVVHTKTC